jgi:hypothetical protein
VKIYRIGRNGVGMCEEDRNGGGGKGSFRVWPKSQLCSGRSDLSMYGPHNVA